MLTTECLHCSLTRSVQVVPSAYRVVPIMRRQCQARKDLILARRRWARGIGVRLFPAPEPLPKVKAVDVTFLSEWRSQGRTNQPVRRRARVTPARGANRSFRRLRVRRTKAFASLAVVAQAPDCTADRLLS